MFVDFLATLPPRTTRMPMTCRLPYPGPPRWLLVVYEDDLGGQQTHTKLLRGRCYLDPGETAENRLANVRVTLTLREPDAAMGDLLRVGPAVKVTHIDHTQGLRDGVVDVVEHTHSAHCASDCDVDPEAPLEFYLQGDYHVILPPAPSASRDLALCDDFHLRVRHRTNTRRRSVSEEPPEEPAPKRRRRSPSE